MTAFPQLCRLLRAVAPVWRAAGLHSLGELMSELAREPSSPLRQAVIEAMATHETTFFRDRQVFETLQHTVLPRLIARRSATRRLRIWSAAASTGQAAYSVAMILAEMAASLSGWTIRLVGTDISTAAIARARAGTYSQLEVQRGLPILMLLRHFEQGQGGWRIAEPLRRSVEFSTVNLLDDIRPLGRFDLVLCRNLLIYLDAPTKAAVLGKLAGALAPDGSLCLGASESPLGYNRALLPDPAARGFLVHAAAEPALRQRATA